MRLARQFLEMRDVIVTEDALFRPRMADTLDHRGMIELIGEDDAAGKKLGQCRERRLVRNVARGEEKRRLLAVQIGELFLEKDVIVIGTGDIARASGAGAAALERLVHGGEYLGMLSHAEIVVRAPHRDAPRLSVTPHPIGAGKLAAAAQKIGENPVAPLGLHRIDGVGQNALVIHHCVPLPAAHEHSVSAPLLRPLLLLLSSDQPIS